MRKSLDTTGAAKHTLPTSTLIENDEFPFEFLSVLAERESWRKEINRPIYHLHKWWAKRLGSVFRGILLGCISPPEADLEKEFYRTHSFDGVTVFDPFMGSGTTIGEAHKLGLTAFGRDINPVAAESVRVALGPLNFARIEDEFRQLERTVGRRITSLYKAKDENSREVDVLYFFWVKQIPCVHCQANVDLFRSRIIARNANPSRKPAIQVVCPHCDDIFLGDIRDSEVVCPSCNDRFDPHRGNTQRAFAVCSACTKKFKVIDSVRNLGRPPEHRLIAKLVLLPGGEKRYLPATADDREAYRQCEAELERQLVEGKLSLPSLALESGYNTRQAINYGYEAWRSFFNARQLLALGWLQRDIATISDSVSRDALLTLFSGALEFNNLFASYKGEGTGAVRHMFSHHILKPERMPIEANVWGTRKSSGAFSSLYRTRLLRVIEYQRAPVEVVRPSRRSRAAEGRVQCSEPFTGNVHTNWPPARPWPTRSVYLSCGSSDATSLPDRCMDLIVTDPPFFDNVHYSELADFFYAWQSLSPRGFVSAETTTRNAKEVQDTNSDAFTEKLRAVFAECCRVLRDDGLLAFTYHHSRPEGWTSLATAVHGAGFSIVNAHPVKAEMSVATPKSQAKEPIQLDVILVCVKRELDDRKAPPPNVAFERACEKSFAKA
ncbi:MAG: adenine-specific DNA methylase, partial [Planctomycetes bacterium]|nr:adenine-specific DNA methylase [Planctomycetota bacterium]